MWRNRTLVRGFSLLLRRSCLPTASDSIPNGSGHEWNYSRCEEGVTCNYESARVANCRDKRIDTEPGKEKRHRTERQGRIKNNEWYVQVSFENSINPEYLKNQNTQNISYNVESEVLTAVVYEEYILLGYNAVQYVESQRTFRRNISPPSSGLSKLCLSPAFTLVSCSAYI
jgi:hypothetical protein